LFSRNARDLSPWFPELLGAGRALQADTLIDGEIVIADEQRRSDFTAHPAVLLVFDVLAQRPARPPAGVGPSGRAQRDSPDPPSGGPSGAAPIGGRGRRNRWDRDQRSRGREPAGDRQ